MGEKEEPGRNYRPWCKEDDEKLVEALVDMVNVGLYKGDNRFKFGYLTYLEVHQKAVKWRNKSFPHYEDLRNIFTKDRAKGNLARDAFEMEEDANRDEVNEEGDYIDESTAHATMPVTTNAREESSMPIPKKKRARSQDPLHVIGAASLLRQEIEASSTKLSATIEFNIDIHKKTNMVILELSKMVSLTTRDMYRALKTITCVSKNVLVFFSFKKEEMEDWVNYFLEDDA